MTIPRIASKTETDVQLSRQIEAIKEVLSNPHQIIPDCIIMDMVINDKAAR